MTAWLLSRPTQTEVARELVEVEDGGSARPALAEAVAWCRPRAASLVVPRTAPIASGPAFHPRIVSVPVVVLPQPHRPAPAVIAAPHRAPERVALYVGHRDDAGFIPLYLTNVGPDALTDVTVDGSGLFLDEGRTVATNGTRHRVGRIEPGTAVLVEERDTWTAGEYLDALHVTFRQGTAMLHGVVVLGLRVRENQFVRLKMGKQLGSDPKPAVPGVG